MSDFEAKVFCLDQIELLKWNGMEEDSIVLSRHFRGGSSRIRNGNFGGKFSSRVDWERFFLRA